MSVRGVWQLQHLSIYYCKSQGSSRGVREFVDRLLPAFREKNPHIQVETIHRNNRHPYLQAHYIDGGVQEIGVRNEDARHVLSTCHTLRNKSGRRTPHKWASARTNTPSVQGFWDPSFNHTPVEAQLDARATSRGGMIGVSPPLPSSSSPSS